MEQARYIQIVAVINLKKVTNVVYKVIDRNSNIIDTFFLHIDGIVDKQEATFKVMKHLKEKFGIEYLEVKS